jgi:hypothetical protein
VSFAQYSLLLWKMSVVHRWCTVVKSLFVKWKNIGRFMSTFWWKIVKTNWKVDVVDIVHLIFSSFFIIADRTNINSSKFLNEKEIQKRVKWVQLLCLNFLIQIVKDFEWFDFGEETEINLTSLNEFLQFNEHFTSDGSP